MARKFVDYPVPLARVEHVTPFGPDKVQITPERAAEIAAEVKGKVVPMFRAPSSTMCETIIDTVAEVTRISKLEIRGDCKKREFAWARFVCVYLIREHTGRSFPQIAKSMNAHDHTTTVCQHKRALELIENDEDFAAMVQECDRRLAE